MYELAAVIDDAVNAQWAVLGFYSRARYLYQGAKYVVDKPGGDLPQSVDGLVQISGIGLFRIATEIATRTLVLVRLTTITREEGRVPPPPPRPHYLELLPSSSAA